jgi:hypothetical protein
MRRVIGMDSPEPFAGGVLWDDGKLPRRARQHDRRTARVRSQPCKAGFQARKPRRQKPAGSSVAKRNPIS